MRKHLLLSFALLMALVSIGMSWEQAEAQRRRGRSMSRGSVRYSPSARPNYPSQNRYQPNYQRTNPNTSSYQRPSDRNRAYGSTSGTRSGEARNRSQNLEDGTYKREGTRGGSAEMNQRTEGDTRTREIQGETRRGTEYEGTGTVKKTEDGLQYQRQITTSEGNTRTVSGDVKGKDGKVNEIDRQAQTRNSSGETVTRSGEAKRDGDDIEYKREGTNRYGDKATIEGKIETDDGRIEKVERETTVEGRYGEEIKREQELDRKDGYWDYDGKTTTSTGREVEVDAVAGRDIYGRPVAYGTADTKYWGNFGVARGPYGGRVVTRLPSSYVPVYFWGYPYYAYGGLYYRPYYYGGVPYYYPAFPPYGAYYGAPPVGSVTIVISGSTFQQKDNVYYQKTQKDGKTAYEVVPAPAGAKVQALPSSAARVTIGETTFYFYANTFYRQTESGGKPAFVVVEAPEGVQTVDALPADFVPIPVDEVTYFAAGTTFYLPWLQGDTEVYLLVDPLPTEVMSQVESAEVEVAEAAGQAQTVTLPTETVLQVRTASEISTGKAKAGDVFAAFLDADLMVDGLIVATKGTRLNGKVVDAKKAGNFSGKAELQLTLTEMVLTSGSMPIQSNVIALDGEKAKSLAVMGVGAGLGAVIGAVADGGSGAAIGAAVGAGAGAGVAAATPGKQVSVNPQTLLQFQLAKALTLQIPQ